jgi:hypothetical protein
MATTLCVFQFDTPIPGLEMRGLGEEAVKIFEEESKRFLAKRKISLKGFPQSFSFRATGDSLILLSSWTWKGEDGSTFSGGRKGRSKSPGRYYEGGKGKSRTAGTPFVDSDKSIKLKSSPMDTDRMWVHPSISKYSFIEVAVQRIQVYVGEMLTRVSADKLAGVLPSEIKC